MQATVTVDDVRRARAAIEGIARRTPVLSSPALSERAGGEVVLKAENLQRTGSFKLRGALAKISALGDAAGAGVVCGSAGNHARAVAEAARQRGVACDVYMPADAPVAKVEAVDALGAAVHLMPGTVKECIAAALERSEQDALAFVHPFDDPDVIAGQGTLGLEILEDVPDVSRVVVPLGGGGLASGVAIAIRSERPEVELIGVQAELCMPFAQSLEDGKPVTVPPGLTIADGIAVRRPGDLTLPLVERWLAGVETVTEDDIGEAMMVLLEHEKLVAEGAGAVGVAALLSGRVGAAPRGATVVIVSGGNVDPALLAALDRRHETVAGRRLVILTSVPDLPGRLARLLRCVGDTGANLVEVSHVREGIDLHARETGIQLVIETRGRDHAERVLHAVGQAGYDARVLR